MCLPMLQVDRPTLADRRIKANVTKSNMMSFMLPGASIALMDMAFPELQNDSARSGKDVVVVFPGFLL